MSEDPTGRVRQAASALGLSIELVERPAAGSLAEAAALLGLEPDDIVKTLVVSRSDGTFLFALVPGDRAISWPKLRAVVGVNKLHLPDADRALAATGYERGTITPFGSTRAWPVVADERVPGRPASIGGGAHGVSATVDGDDLVRALAATVADVTDPEPPR